MAPHFDVPLIEAKGLCPLLLRLRDYFGQQHKVEVRSFLAETLGDQQRLLLIAWTLCSCTPAAMLCGSPGSPVEVPTWTGVKAGLADSQHQFASYVSEPPWRCILQPQSSCPSSHWISGFS